MSIAKTVFIIFILQSLDAIASGLFLPVSTHLFVTTGNHFSFNALFDTGWVIMLSPAYFLFSPIFGLMSDENGRKKIICCCILLSCLGYLCILTDMTREWPWINLLGSLLIAIGNALSPLLLAALVDVSQGHKRVINFGIFAAVIMLDLLFAQGVGYFLASLSPVAQLPIRRMLLMSILLLEILNFTIALLFLPETKKMAAHFSALSQQMILTALIRIFFNRKIIYFLGLLFIGNAAWGLYCQNIVTYLTQRLHFANNLSALFVLLGAAIQLLGMFLLYPLLIKRFSLTKLFYIVSIIVLICLLLEGVFPYATTYWILILPVSIGFAMINPIMWYLIADITDPAHYGLVMGIAFPLWAVAWVTSNILSYFFGLHLVMLPLYLSIFLMLTSVAFARRLYKTENALLSDVPSC